MTVIISASNSDYIGKQQWLYQQVAVTISSSDSESIGIWQWLYHPVTVTKTASGSDSINKRQLLYQQVTATIPVSDYIIKWQWLYQQATVTISASDSDYAMIRLSSSANGPRIALTQSAYWQQTRECHRMKRKPHKMSLRCHIAILWSRIPASSGLRDSSAGTIDGPN